MLFQIAFEKLRTDKIVRPGLTCLERLVVTARLEAQYETFRLLPPLLSGECKTLLDGLLVPDGSRSGTTLAWLRRPAVSNSPKAILRNIEKLEFLKRAGVVGWTLDGLSPNRLKRLAQIARRATGQALQRMPEERRHPLLVAFLHQSLIDIADETIDQFDRCLAEAQAQTGHDLEEFRGSVAQTTNEVVRLFGELARVVLDSTVRDAQLRQAIYRRISAERLQRAFEESSRIVRPEEDAGFDFLRRRYGHLRQFSPRIRDLGDQQLYRLDRSPRYRNLEPRLQGPIHRDRILRRWDDLLRVAGSLKRGWVTVGPIIEMESVSITRTAAHWVATRDTT